MNRNLTRDEEERARELIRRWHCDELVQRVKEADAAQRAAKAAVTALEHFDRNGLLDGSSDSYLIALWAGGRAVRATADDIRRHGRVGTDAVMEERMLILGWLVDQGYDIGDDLAADVHDNFKARR